MKIKHFLSIVLAGAVVCFSACASSPHKAIAKKEYIQVTVPERPAG